MPKAWRTGGRDTLGNEEKSAKKSPISNAGGVADRRTGQRGIILDFHSFMTHRINPEACHACRVYMLLTLSF
jgi:hypothetical protein